MYKRLPKIETIKEAQLEEYRRQNSITSCEYFEKIFELIKREGYNALTFTQYKLINDDEYGEFADFYVENYNLTGEDNYIFCCKLMSLANRELKGGNPNIYIKGYRFYIKNLTE